MWARGLMYRLYGIQRCGHAEVVFNSLELGVGGHAEGLDSTWDIYTLSSELVLASDLERHSSSRWPHPVVGWGI